MPRFDSEKIGEIHKVTPVEEQHGWVPWAIGFVILVILANIGGGQ